LRGSWRLGRCLISIFSEIGHGEGFLGITLGLIAHTIVDLLQIFVQVFLENLHLLPKILIPLAGCDNLIVELLQAVQCFFNLFVLLFDFILQIGPEGSQVGDVVVFEVGQ
jgi:hypothetical protein